MPLRPLSFDGALERQIVELHTWVVREGIRGAAADALFDSLCQRFVIAGVPLWRAFAGMPTLHPQWGGYSYTWRRDLNAIEPGQFGRGYEYEQILENSPFGYLIRQIEDSSSRGKSLAAPASASRWTRGKTRFSDSQGVSPPPALPIISRRSSNSARTGTPLAAPASAIRSRPTVPADSATMILVLLRAVLPAGLPRDDDTCRPHDRLRFTDSLSGR